MLLFEMISFKMKKGREFIFHSFMEQIFSISFAAFAKGIPSGDFSARGGQVGSFLSRKKNPSGAIKD